MTMRRLFDKLKFSGLFRRRSALTFLIGSSLGLAVVLLILFNILLLWVATGPRSLNNLTPYIERALQPEDNKYSVKIGESWLIWDGWQHPIDIRLRNVAVLTHEGQLFSHFPEISLGVDVLSLPLGRLLPTSLTINHPIISLFQNEDHSISFGFQKEPPPADTPAAEAPPTAEESPIIPFAVVLGPLMEEADNSNLRKLRQITIMNANVSVGSVKKGVFFKATDADIVLKRDYRGVVRAFTNATIAYGKYQSLVNAQLIVNKPANAVSGELTVSQLMVGPLAGMFFESNPLSGLQFPVSGKGKLLLSMDGTLQQLTFALMGGKGSIHSEKLDGDLPVKAVQVDGQVKNNGAEITIDRLNADLDGMLVAANGTVAFKEGDTAIKGRAIAKNVPAANVHLFWPPGVSPESRKWVTENIRDGMATSAGVDVNIAFGDLAKPVLPREAIDATVALEGGKVRYLAEHPEVNNVKGVLHIDAVSLEASLDSGSYMKSTALSSGHLLIEDLNADNPYIKVKFAVTTSAKDAVRFLNLPRLKHAARLNLSDDTAEGTLAGNASVGFHFFAPHDAKGKELEPDVDYDVTADVKDIASPNFMKKFDIRNADGKLIVNNQLLEFKGRGGVNGASITSADVKYLFKPDKEGFDTFIDADANAPVAALPSFGYPAFPFLKGNLALHANIRQGENDEQYDTNIDLTNAAVTFDELQLFKPDKQPASFDLKAEKKNGVVTMPAFHFKGQNMDAVGAMDLTPDLSAIQRINLSSVHYGQVDLSHLLYEKIEGGIKIEAQGNSGDVSGWLKGGDDSNFSFEHFPAFQLKADVERLILSKGHSISNVKGEMQCTLQRCENANINAATNNGKPISFRIMRNPKGKRQLSLHAEDAGEFLRAIDFFDGMEGGDLTITGNFDDGANTSVFKGRVDIDEHVIKHAPVLAKILSLASLTGFFDTLQGNGIRFVRLRAPFTLAHDVITIEDAKTHGPAIGMTADGTITFPKRTLDIKGTVVPAYTLNNVIGKVPLVGQVLTGGEGGGIFAASYTVRGSESNPDVTVNPLSILAPGFLRGLFSAIDTPANAGSGV